MSIAKQEAFCKQAKESADILLAHLPALVITLGHIGQILALNGAEDHNLAQIFKGYLGRKLVDVPEIGETLWTLSKRAVSENRLLSQFALEHKSAASYTARLRFDAHAQAWPEQHALKNANKHEGQAFSLLFLMPQFQGAGILPPPSLQTASAIKNLGAALAHEIKNPLASIKGAAQLMGRALPEGKKRLSELVEEEVDRITNLVDQLTNTGLMPERPLRRVNIHTAIKHALELNKISARPVSSLLHFDPSLPEIEADYDQLVQILVNLIQNAIEAAHSEAACQIIMTTRYRRGLWQKSENGPKRPLTIELVFSDNGPGVPEAYQSQLFEPFFTTKTGNRGLGLALSALYMAHMGGQITYEAGQGKGACFILNFAQAKPDAISAGFRHGDVTAVSESPIL